MESQNNGGRSQVSQIITEILREHPSLFSDTKTKSGDFLFNILLENFF